MKKTFSPQSFQSLSIFTPKSRNISVQSCLRYSNVGEITKKLGVNSMEELGVANPHPPKGAESVVSKDAYQEYLRFASDDEMQANYDQAEVARRNGPSW